MKIEDIRKMRDRAPFRTFELHLTNGEVFEVRHPESMSLPDDEKEMFVIWTEEGWNLIDAAQVARLSVKRKTGK